MTGGRALRIYLVAGEESGDQLGAGLMRALRAANPGRDIVFLGLGGERMRREGLDPIFPMEEISVMGILPVLAALPAIVRRAYRVIADVVAQDPDALIIIDSPDFTQPIARRVHRRAPHIPIVNYVSPSVWAWRPGARAQDARLCRSRIGAQTLRARCSSAPGRATLQLCRPSVDRETRSSASGAW